MWQVLISLAARNIFRNRRRTTLTSSLSPPGWHLSLSSAGLSLTPISRCANRRSILNWATLAIFQEGYSAHPGDASQYFIHDFDNVAKQIAIVPGVHTVTARLGFSGLVSTGEKTVNCLATGVMAEREQQLSSAESIIAGHALTAADTNGSS